MHCIQRPACSRHGNQVAHATICLISISTLKTPNTLKRIKPIINRYSTSYTNQKNIIMNTEINKEILERNNIAVKSRMTVWPFALLAVAAAAFGIAFALDNAREAKMPVLFAAIILTIFGITKLFTLPKVLFHITSEETFTENTLYFESEKKNSVLAMLEKGEFTKLKSEAKERNSMPIKVEMYETASGSIVLYRVYNFIPYTYEPVTDYIVYKKAC